MDVEFNIQSTITLKPMKTRKEKKNYIVESLHSGEFYEMPEICIVAIEMLNDGSDLLDCENVLKDRYPNENVDMIDFIHDLLDLGLVHSVDGKAISSKQPNPTNNNGLKWISPKIGRFFFNRCSTSLYFVSFISSLFLFLWKPELFPSYHDVFVFDLMMYNILVFLGLTFFLVLIHEIGHVLAVRSENLPTNIEVGHRLFFVVLETDMSRVWSLPPDRRNRLYLAGMYFDSVLLISGLLLQLAFASNFLIVGVSKMVVFSTFIRMLYQCCVYMKTDLYYVLENRSGCYNLMENGQNFLRRWLPFVPAVNTSQAFEGEERLVRPYAIFYLIGILITLGVLVFYNIPLIVHAGALVMPGLSEPVSSILFWDAVVFFLQFVIILSLLAYSYTKKYRLSH